MKDTLTIGVFAGAVGTVVMHIFSIIFKSFSLITVTTLDYAAALFLNPDQTKTTAGIIVAIISHLMIGAGGGVLLAYFLKVAGKDFYWLKGFVLAGFMLLVGMSFVLNIMDVMPEIREDSMTVLFHFITYAAYGLTVSFIIARYDILK